MVTGSGISSGSSGIIMVAGSVGLLDGSSCPTRRIHVAIVVQCGPSTGAIMCRMGDPVAVALAQQQPCRSRASYPANASDDGVELREDLIPLFEGLLPLALGSLKMVVKLFYEPFLVLLTVL